MNTPKICHCVRHVFAIATITDQVRNKGEWGLHKGSNESESGCRICRTGVIFMEEEIALDGEDGHGV
jgi:hypothetical protein